VRPVEPAPDGVRLTLHVQPRASRTGLAGLHGEAIKVRLAAPPVDGAANAELVRFLAELLGVPRSAVEIVSGRTGRRKVVLVRGVAPEEALARLGCGVGD
jgi:uncharacterized protein (TIGR00251 family)